MHTFDIPVTFSMEPSAPDKLYFGSTNFKSKELTVFSVIVETSAPVSNTNSTSFSLTFKMHFILSSLPYSHGGSVNLTIRGLPLLPL